MSGPFFQEFECTDHFDAARDPIIRPARGAAVRIIAPCLCCRAAKSFVNAANNNSVKLHTVALASGVDLGVLARLAGETGGSLARAHDARRLISYYGALGSYLSGTGMYYRTAWRMNVTGSNTSFTLGRGGWVQYSIAINAPGGVIYVPFRINFN